jgi:hypothetical protein
VGENKHEKSDPGTTDEQGPIKDETVPDPKPDGKHDR